MGQLALLWAATALVATAACAAAAAAAAPGAPFLPPGGGAPQPALRVFDCPGVARGACTLTCQRATCEALAALYRAAHNESRPWTRQPWRAAFQDTPCYTLIPAPGGGAPPSPPPFYCSLGGVDCCGPADVAAGRCGALHAVWGIHLGAGNVNGSVSDPKLMDAIEQLHACGLRELDLESNMIAGQITQRWGRLTNLTVINLANNWLSGTIPAELARLEGLRVLDLGGNFLRGPLGAWVGGLSALEVLSLGSNMGVSAGGPGAGAGRELRGITGTLPAALTGLTRLVELNLQTNSISGTIPEALCGPTSRLRELSLRSNRISGPAAAVTRCHELSSLDLSNNLLTGSLPATANWMRLVSLLLQGNQFRGGVPRDLYLTPILSYLDISDNKLEGPLDDRISLLTYLTTFNAAGNRLSGALPQGVFNLPQLAALDLGGNMLTGTVQPSLGLAYSLRDVSFAGNQGLIGSLPQEAGALPTLRRIDLRNTSMSCVPADVALAARQAAGAAADPRSSPPPQQQQPCPAGALLPCFLEFGSFDAPRGDGDGGGLRCRTIRRKRPDAAAASCPPAARGPLGQRERAAADGGAAEEGLLDRLGEQWELPPAYYQYQGCSCVQGYREQWGEGGTALTCASDRGPLAAWAWALVALGGALLLLAAAFALAAGRWVLLRSRRAREAELRRKHARWAALKAGARVSIVVTDIDGFSELAKSRPGLARKALAMHNAVMRKAAHEQAGNIIEQEGGGWAVAFHEAVEAVAFCLQAQQALHKVAWPTGLTHPSAATSDAAARAAGAPAAGAGAIFDQRGRLMQLVSVGALGVLPPAYGPARGAGGASGALGAARSASGARPEDYKEELLLGHMPLTGSRAGRWPGAGVSRGAAGPYGGGRAGGLRGWGSSSPRAADVARGRLLEGLLVRMGVASGVLGDAADLFGCAPLRLAKTVCGAANGGQVLLEGATFSAVRERRQELGAVDEDGLDHRKLPGSRGPWSIWGPCGAWLSWARRGAAAHEGPAGLGLLCLDMGEWMVPGLNLGDHESEDEAPEPLWPPEDGGCAVRLGLLRPGPGRGAHSSRAAAAAGPRAGTGGGGGELVRFYSVLPFCLAGRARIWLGTLETQDSWLQTDRGFFDAPGTASALLSPSDAAAPPPLPPPPVALVSAAVEGARALARPRRDADLRRLGAVLRAALLETLDAAGSGGYLCGRSEGDGDLRYTLAFPNADAALRWCLMAQEALMYAPWPQGLLLTAPELAEVHAPDQAGGELLFRGPRLKMGVCEGVPTSVEPDRWGRASYRGAGVGGAARFVGASAHGGQVVCEERLADAVFRSWRLAGAGIARADNADDPADELEAGAFDPPDVAGGWAGQEDGGAPAPQGGGDHIDDGGGDDGSDAAGDVGGSSAWLPACSSSAGRAIELLRRSFSGARPGSAAGGPERRARDADDLDSAPLLDPGRDASAAAMLPQAEMSCLSIFSCAVGGGGGGALAAPAVPAARARRASADFGINSASMSMPGMLVFPPASEVLRLRAAPAAADGGARAAPGRRAASGALAIAAAKRERRERFNDLEVMPRSHSMPQLLLFPSASEVLRARATASAAAAAAAPRPLPGASCLRGAPRGGGGGGGGRPAPELGAAGAARGETRSARRVVVVAPSEDPHDALLQHHRAESLRRPRPAAPAATAAFDARPAGLHGNTLGAAAPSFPQPERPAWLQPDTDSANGAARLLLPAGLGARLEGAQDEGDKGELEAAAGAAAPPHDMPQYCAAVRAYHLGSFVSEGSAPVSLVNVTTRALAPRARLPPQEEPRGGRARRVTQRSGVAAKAAVLLPDALPGRLWEFYLRLNAEGGAAQQGEGWAARGAREAYKDWLASELVRRELRGAAGASGHARGSVGTRPRRGL